MAKSYRTVKPASVDQRRPLVTVLISVYNGAETLKDCLDSVAVQSYRPLEIMCVNDASTDDTGVILDEWTKRHKEMAVTVINNNENIGLTRSLNRGLKQVRGKYVARIDADDVWLPEKIARQVYYLERHADVGVLGTAYLNIKEGKHYLFKLPEKDNLIRKSIFRQNPFGHSCVLIRTSLLKIHQGYDEQLRYGQDRDLWYRLLPQTKFHNLAEPLCWRQAEHGVSITSSRAQMIQSIKTTAKYINLYRANPGNYLFLIKPLVIAIMPRTIKRIYKNLVYRQLHLASGKKINVIYINDCFLPSRLANAVVRIAMAEALADHERIKAVKFCYHARLMTDHRVTRHQSIEECKLSAPYVRARGALGRVYNATLFGLSSWRYFFMPWPADWPIIYMRVGALTGALVALRSLIMPREIIFELHNFEFGHNRIMDKIYHFIFKQSALLVTVASTTGANWVAHGIPARKILVIPSGVFYERFSKINMAKAKLREILHLPIDKTVLMYCGNLYRHRGIEEIMNSAHSMSDEAGVIFVLVGGQQKDIDYYRRYRRERGFKEENVSFIGYRAYDQIPLYLQAADVLLVTYAKCCPTANSMSPLKLIEGLAARVPVIAPDMPRINDIVNSNMVTWYTPDETTSLVNAIKEIINDPEAAKAKSERGYIAGQKFSWNRRVDRILNRIV